MTWAALALLLAAAPAAAPVVVPGDRPGLGDLAYALGEAHALRQACRGGSDGVWRTRMSGVIAAEHLAAERRTQLVERFNAGFAAAKASHPSCGAETRDDLRETLARAAPLARTLAHP